MYSAYSGDRTVAEQAAVASDAPLLLDVNRKLYRTFYNQQRPPQ